MGENILKLIYYIFYTLELLLVGEAIFHNRVRGKLRYATVIVLYLLIIVSTMLLLGNVNFLLKLALNIIVYVSLFQGKILSRLASFFGVYFFTGTAESIVNGIAFLLLHQPLERLGISTLSVSVRLILDITSATLVLLIITRKGIQKFISYFLSLKWFQYAAIIMIAFSGALVMLISEVVLDYIDNKKVGEIFHFSIIILLGTTFVGIIWFVSTVYAKEYYLKQNQLKEEIIHMQQQYYQNIYENDREMRKFRHDIHSHLGCLQLLMSEGKIEQAIRHLETVENNFEKIKVYKYHTGNEILDVIINQKCMEAKKKNINIIVEGKLNTADFIDAYDLCTIFANALNNGMEAYNRIQNKEKVIHVSILEHERTILFRFDNFATDEMYEALKQNRSTKEDNQNHGFGAENIRMAVEKNGGDLEYHYNNENLILEIYFEM